jgi:PIN like domain
VTFFFDTCLSPKYAVMIRDAYNEDVCVLKDHFPVETPDENWLPVIGARGWVLVTEDKRIRVRPQERRALQLSGVTTFFLGKSFGELKLLEKGQALVAVWPKIQATATICQRGSLYMVSVKGGVEELQHMSTK